MLPAEIVAEDQVVERLQREPMERFEAVSPRFSCTELREGLPSTSHKNLAETSAVDQIEAIPASASNVICIKQDNGSPYSLQENPTEASAASQGTAFTTSASNANDEDLHLSALYSLRGPGNGHDQDMASSSPGEDSSTSSPTEETSQSSELQDTPRSCHSDSSMSQMVGPRGSSHCGQQVSTTISGPTAKASPVLQRFKRSPIYLPHTHHLSSRQKPLFSGNEGPRCDECNDTFLLQSELR